MEKLYVIKIGGNIINSDEKLTSFLKNFSQIEQHKILVHGGGRVASEIMQSMGIQPKMIDGRRITDEDTLKVVTMVYGGLLNKNIVAKLQANNCNAIGFTGADANIIKAVKRPVKEIDYGFAGDIVNVNTDALRILIDQNFTPVLAPLTHDKKGKILNTNADTIAAEVSVTLSQHYYVILLYCFEHKGVLQSIDDPDSVIHNISYDNYPKLKTQDIISEGMIPKLDNAFNSLKKGIQQIMICHADDVIKISSGDYQTCTQLFI